MSQDDVQGMKAAESGQTQRMSIALTIGATIGVIGLVLLLYGLFGNANYSRSAGININLWWGLLMFVFGAVMSVGSYILNKRRRAH
jgi:drug/metabolite transporter (DMT)-like permease